MLSLALIVKNEEKNLARLLDSAKGVWDELVIVDTGSTDATVEIAKKYTDKVYFFQWIDDFAAARNFSFSKCTHPWIMWLDADDVLHPEDVATIRKELPEIDTDPSIDMITFNYEYFVIPDEEASKEKGWSTKDVSHATLVRERIIRKDVATWVGRVHEVIPVNFSKSKSIQASVWHMRDEEDRAADCNRNIRIMKLEVEERPTERNYYYLGQEYADNGQVEEAVGAYERAFELTKSIDTKFQASFKIARILKALGKQDDAIKWFFKSFNYHVAYREPFVDLAQVYFDRRDFSKAAMWLEAAIRIDAPKNPIMITQKEYYSWLPLDRLAKSYHELGRYNEAIETLKKLWKETKNINIINDIAVVEGAKKKHYKYPQHPVKLNLGCGNKPIPGGYINCDLFPSEITDEIFDFVEVPYGDATVAEIHSEHSLEHVPRLRAEKAVREWARVLAPGGKLHLKIPDLELCCKKYVEDPKNRNNWWLFTLYGIQDFRHDQTPFQEDINYGQIHYTGWTKDSISELLAKNGLVVDSISNYDGWDTPSIEVIAHKVKPTNSKKIAFINNSLIPRYLSYGDYWLDAFRVAGHQVDEFKYETISSLPEGYDLYFFIEVRYTPAQIAEKARPRLLYTTETPPLSELSHFDYVATPDPNKTIEWASPERTILNIPNGNHSSGVSTLTSFLTRSSLVSSTSTPKKVDIIIPNYKNLPYLQLTVESVRKNTKDYNLIICNSGDDAAVRYWLSQQTDLVVIDTHGKRSFSENINQALLRSRNDVVVLNNDVIVGKNWLDGLKNSPYDITNPYSNCDAGWIHHNTEIVGGVSLTPNMFIGQVDHGALMDFESPRNELIDRPWVAFYATHIKRAVIDKVGLLSETYLNGCEDFDYCRRAGKFGFTCGHNFKSWVFHYGGKTRKISENENFEQHQTEDVVNQQLMSHHSKPTVVMYTGPAWERWTVDNINTTGIGGSETCAALLCKEFVRKGYRAVIIGDCDGSEGTYDGVDYVNHTKWDKFKNTNYIDFLIASRTLNPLNHHIPNGQNYVWSHDIWIPGVPKNHPMPNDEKVTKYICLSPWHVDFFSDHHKVPKSRIHIQGNGLDISRYEYAEQKVKDPYKLIYSSSPDRGLDNLLRMFKRWKEEFPQLSLHVFYGFHNWESAIQQRNNPHEMALMNEIKRLMEQDGVVYHGRVSQKVLAEHQMSASIWAYPTQFTETYCITASECMAAGAIPVTSSVAALQTTIPDGCGLKVGDPANVYEAVLDLLRHPEKQTVLRNNGRNYAVNKVNWDEVTNNWISMFNQHVTVPSS